MKKLTRFSWMEVIWLVAGECLFVDWCVDELWRHGAIRYRRRRFPGGGCISRTRVVELSEPSRQRKRHRESVSKRERRAAKNHDCSVWSDRLLSIRIAAPNDSITTISNGNPLAWPKAGSGAVNLHSKSEASRRIGTTPSNSTLRSIANCAPGTR